jgi:hypothetical protein
MKRILVGLALALIVAVPLTRPVAAASHSQAHARATLAIHFTAKVYNGPDKGMLLNGTLSLHIAPGTGATTGSLIRMDGMRVPVGGRVQNGAVNLFFDLSRQNHLFGVGTMVYYTPTMQMLLGGPLVGPRPGDSGDWAANGHISSFAGLPPAPHVPGSS